MSRETGACWPYNGLELDDKTTDRKTVKRAYAKVLKRLDQQADADAFQELRSAYEYALQICAGTATPELLQLPTQDYVLDDLQAPKVDESSVDPLVAQWRLVGQISEQSILENDETRIRRILSKIDLSDPDIRQEAENEIMQLFGTYIEENSFGIFFDPNKLSTEIVILCNETFGWMDDAIGWQDRTWVEPDFILAVQNSLNRKSVGPLNSGQKLHEWLFTYKAWGPWLIGSYASINMLNRHVDNIDVMQTVEHYLLVIVPFCVIIIWPAAVLILSLSTVVGGLIMYGFRFAKWVKNRFRR